MGERVDGEREEEGKKRGKEGERESLYGCVCVRK